MSKYIRSLDENRTHQISLSFSPAAYFDPALVKQQHSLCHHSFLKIKPPPALALHKLWERYNARLKKKKKTQRLYFTSLNKHVSAHFLPRKCFSFSQINYFNTASKVTQSCSNLRCVCLNLMADGKRKWEEDHNVPQQNVLSVNN